MPQTSKHTAWGRMKLREAWQTHRLRRKDALFYQAWPRSARKNKEVRFPWGWSSKQPAFSRQGERQLLALCDQGVGCVWRYNSRWIVWMTSQFGWCWSSTNQPGNSCWSFQQDLLLCKQIMQLMKHDLDYPVLFICFWLLTEIIY